MHGFHFIQDLAVILAVGGVVGWVCQRLGLSVVLGYLVAGMVVGPYTPPISLVSDPGRIETLAQIGLVFLMFSIGLRLSVRKLRRLGLSLMLATLAGALVVFYFSRVLGGVLDWSGAQGLFLAAMLMVSSSAIISRILQETGATHERSGQLAMGVAVIEDVVAVVMLTLLNSLVGLDRSPGTQIASTVLLLGAFVVLAGIGGLLLVPWLLRRMSIAADEELQTIGIAALLFGLAVIAQGAGYSLALGAFLLGTIVAETMHRQQVERIFEGMRDVFSAVFFVAIGLQIDAREVWAQIGTVVGLGLFAVVVRALAVSFGLTLIGTPAKDAARTGLRATPIGEFSFIIAQLGVAAALVPRSFYPLAVGISLVTTLVAPVLSRHSEAIVDFGLKREPRWLRDWLAAYRGWLERLRERRRRNLVWQLSRKRVAQVGIGALFVTGVVVFSGELLKLVERWVGPDWLFPHDVEIGFWTGLVALSIAPLVAIWRNLSAMAMLYAELSTRGHPHGRKWRPVVETAWKAAAAIGMGLWLFSIVPVGVTTRWLLLFSGVLALVAVLVLRRKLIYWHSEMEVEILNAIDTDPRRMSTVATPWLQPHGDWNLQMLECTLPDLADCQGRSIAELDLRAQYGCSVVGVERQGFMIPLPPPDTVLYPRDKVLLLGTAEQVKAGQACLVTVSGARGADSVFEEVSLEVMSVPAWSPAVDQALGALLPAQTFGVQIAGLRRGGLRILNPAAQEVLRAGDEILVLGTALQNADFRTWLQVQDDGDGRAEGDGAGGPQAAP
ncbi:cation:proton antiporter [Opitutus sp. ER46]|uniref:cation:proton antiporter domain-containing protein n=1 Tax=Opitutus sp. ER46 TaxID=2161864 RepID=UPI000D320802|nr:cation:proton antiporter [Opitutus sp. ER46]PTX97777.1 sodium:proton exchanger [Opitutus sp. ER46]